MGERLNEINKSLLLGDLFGFKGQSSNRNGINIKPFYYSILGAADAGATY